MTASAIILCIFAVYFVLETELFMWQARQALKRFDAHFAEYKRLTELIDEKEAELKKLKG